MLFSLGTCSQSLSANNPHPTHVPTNYIFFGMLLRNVGITYSWGVGGAGAYTLSDNGYHEMSPFDA